MTAKCFMHLSRGRSKTFDKIPKSAQTMVMKKFMLSSFLVMLVLSAAIILVIVPVSVASSLPEEIRLTHEEFSSSAPLHLPRGKIVQQNTNSLTLVGDDEARWIELKLFGIIPIKKIKVDILPIDEVYIGGELLGFVVQINGALVTKDGNDLKKGDLIVEVEGQTVSNAEEFEREIENNKGKETLEVKAVRGGKGQRVRVKNGRTLGLAIKDETSGVGTLTYVNPDNNNFSALGHGIHDFETGAGVPVRSGTIYPARIFGIEKSVNKKIGGYKSILRQEDGGAQGDIKSSTEFGIKGCMLQASQYAKASEKQKITSRYAIKPGKAILRTTLENGEVKDFQIEIIKARYQKKPSSKSMVIRIVDKELLEKTGGIVHGMSGSPIIQNGKLVGALTHVVLGDATKGYGIYIDWLV